MGDLCSCWDNMNNFIILQHTEIKASFQKSLIMVEHRFNKHFFAKLRGLVSRTALIHIANEFERVKIVGIDSSLCGCTIRSTHGLPCACELARYSTRCSCIPLHAIHSHWKRLTFAYEGHRQPWDNDDLSLQPEFDALSIRFQELDFYGKVMLKSKVREIAYPETTSLCPPPGKVRTKGAPKGRDSKHERSTKRDLSYFEHVDSLQQSVHASTSIHPSTQASTKSSHASTRASNKVGKRKNVLPMIDEFPCEIHEYIQDIIDVKADGNCGYRAIAALLGKNEDAWPQIRVDLIRELQSCREEYVQLFGSDERVTDLLQSLYVDNIHGVSLDKWMVMPDMGYIIATKYNVVFIHLSALGWMTFFPLRGRPPLSLSNHRIISIGFVHNCHFVQVK